MRILPALAERARSVRLLVWFFACYAIAGTGGLLFCHRLVFLPVYFATEWLLLIALPVVVVLGFFWAVSVKPTDRP